jgi:hypothetical protein
VLHHGSNETPRPHCRCRSYFQRKAKMPPQSGVRSTLSSAAVLCSSPPSPSCSAPRRLASSCSTTPCRIDAL